MSYQHLLSDMKSANGRHIVNNTPTLNRLTYPVSEVIRLSGLSRTEIYRRVKSGELDSIRVGAKGGKIAVPASALARLLNGNHTA